MFRRILLNLIKLYWKIIPERKRRVCIYKESCSKHVFKILKEEGSISGIKATFRRLKNCNNSYKIEKEDGTLRIRTSTEEIIEFNNINPIVVKGF